MPPMLAGLLWLLDRWQVRRGSYFPSGLEMHFGWLLALSYLGALTHPLLDWQTAYAIQLFSPFDTRWYHTDGLFIIDIWILFGLGAAIALSKRREGREQDNWRRPAIAALAVLVAYVTVNAGISELARRAVSLGPPYVHPQVIVASPPPAAFWRRGVIWQAQGSIARGSFDPTHALSGLIEHTKPVPNGMDDPIARRAMAATPEVIRFMRWSILPMAQVRREGCSAKVSFNDARFSDGLGRDRFWISATVLLEPDECGPVAAGTRSPR